VGGDQLQSVLHLPSAISQVLEGTLLLALLAGNCLSAYRLRRVAVPT
jgi:ABC-type uncharacterized transport system permease subunit